MKEKSIKQLILDWVDGKGWVFGGKIEDYIRAERGAKASNASRRCRELVEEGLLEKQLHPEMRVVMYRKVYKDNPVFSPITYEPPREAKLFNVK